MVIVRYFWLPILALFITIGQVFAADDSGEKAQDLINKDLKNVERVELILILDKSGSMYNLTTDTIGGYNSMIAKQKESALPAKVTTVLFNNKSEFLYTQKDLAEVPEMTTKEYSAESTTALLDAIGSTIRKVDSFEGISDKTTQVIVVIITDGYENASKEYNLETIKSLVSERQNTKDWKFIFMGANIDAIKAADSLGIDTRNAVKYKNTSVGVKANFDAVANFTQSAAEGNTASEEWKDLVQQDK